MPLQRWQFSCRVKCKLSSIFMKYRPEKYQKDIHKCCLCQASPFPRKHLQVKPTHTCVTGSTPRHGFRHKIFPSAYTNLAIASCSNAGTLTEIRAMLLPLSGYQVTPRPEVGTACSAPRLHHLYQHHTPNWSVMGRTGYPPLY